MCVVSMIVDDWWGRNKPWVQPFIPVEPLVSSEPVILATKDELDKLRKEFEELKKLLTAAKEYDKMTGQPDCEMESKVAILRKIAEVLEIDISKLLPIKQ